MSGVETVAESDELDAIRASFEEILDYMWDDEADDYDGCLQDDRHCAHHIFPHMLRVWEWLDGDHPGPPSYDPVQEPASE
ncbi:MAG: hypothetical protein ACP5H2_05200 [Solirubrobacteraceae bacterium]